MLDLYHRYLTTMMECLHPQVQRVGSDRDGRIHSVDDSSRAVGENCTHARHLPVYEEY